MEAEDIKRLVIAGGGTAGWMAAASLSEHFQGTGLKIILIESSAIGTVGVGEATIPSIRRFYGELGISDAEIIDATRASCKLAIRFDGWRGQEQHFYHPFGLYGQDVRNVAFHHYWLKMYRLGLSADIAEFSLGVALADAKKFTPPSPNPPSSLSIFDWALHFDASLFAAFMKDFALANGVSFVDAKIINVRLRNDDGFIEALELDDGSSVDGDLFIDCSGFRGILIEGALKTGYEEWTDWLFCDRAIAMQSDHDEPGTNLPPYTRAMARGAGWQWKIPLQNRQGNGYVFSSAFISEDEAVETLTRHVRGKLRTDPGLIKFVPGRRRKAWNKNCISLGLAAGFLEPLESTSIALIETGIARIKLLFPDRSFCRGVIDEFNEMTALEYERVRDFIILHYRLNGREGEAFWDACRNVEVPETLRYKMDLFEARGHLVKYRWEMFQSSSWISIYHGLGFLPERYDPAVDAFDPGYLESAFRDMRGAIEAACRDAPPHREFIAYTAGASHGE